MITMLEMAEAILKTYRQDGSFGQGVGASCQHCKAMEEAPLWVITHSPDCIVLKCEHLKKMCEYNNISRMEAEQEAFAMSKEQLRGYHVTAVLKLNSYADDSDLRESDVKHYRKRAAFHQTMVETIDQAIGAPSA